MQHRLEVSMRAGERKKPWDISLDKEIGASEMTKLAVSWQTIQP